MRARRSCAALSGAAHAKMFKKKKEKIVKSRLEYRCSVCKSVSMPINASDIEDGELCWRCGKGVMEKIK